MLRALLEQGCGWGFLPTHMHAEQWKNVNTLHTEVGSQDQPNHGTIWKPGNDRRCRHWMRREAPGCEKSLLN